MPKLTWLSYVLLLAAYSAFGHYLHRSEAPSLGWSMTSLFVIALAGIMTMLWQPTQKLALLGFKSVAGYFAMVLTLASLAVLALTWIHISAYILVMFAASLLVRIDVLTLDLSNSLSFLILCIIPLLGLGLSWLPLLLTQA
ncbi:MAG: hypothetical protein QNJ46_11195 [Leptolyngbyaceae cyanobacterium MO_188.B28]|nr:hypothetical protein [Leptolyngbyaceae cyanobacterium MO_188.B28]